MSGKVFRSLRRRLSELSTSSSSPTTESIATIDSMVDADIRLNYIDGQAEDFYTGDRVSGSVELTLPNAVPLENVSITLECFGEVRWVEYHGAPQYLSGYVYYDTFEFLKAKLEFSEDDVKIQQHPEFRNASIPFSYVLPKDQNLPSSMISNNGFIQYCIKVCVRMPPGPSDASDDAQKAIQTQEKKDEEEVVKKFMRELIVQAPIEKSLMVTVSGSAEKTVLLHAGTVSMNASLRRKGFYPSESIPVHISIVNRTNTAVTPKLALKQIQIFKCGEQHKTLESTLNEQLIVGPEVPAHSDGNEVLQVPISVDESLSIKTRAITIKYNVTVTLDIPHSFNLNIILPVVVTGQRLLEEMQRKDPNAAQRMDPEVDFEIVQIESDPDAGEPELEQKDSQKEALLADKDFEERWTKSYMDDVGPEDRQTQVI